MWLEMHLVSLIEKQLNSITVNLDGLKSKVSDLKDNGWKSYINYQIDCKCYKLYLVNKDQTIVANTLLPAINNTKDIYLIAQEFKFTAINKEKESIISLLKRVRIIQDKDNELQSSSETVNLLSKRSY